MSARSRKWLWTTGSHRESGATSFLVYTFPFLESPLRHHSENSPSVSLLPTETEETWHLLWDHVKLLPLDHREHSNQQYYCMVQQMLYFWPQSSSESDEDSWAHHWTQTPGLAEHLLDTLLEKGPQHHQGLHSPCSPSVCFNAILQMPMFNPIMDNQAEEHLLSSSHQTA